MANRETGDPLQADMHVRIGSITKSMTATLIHQLVDEGKLGLNDSLATTLPDAADFPYADHIKLRHLMNLRSGIFNFTQHEGIFANLPSDPDRIWTDTELLDIARQHEPDFEPGTDFHYPNTNYVMLGMIVERLTGLTFGDALQQRILTPFGLSATSALPEPFTYGYERILARPDAGIDARGAEGEPETTLIDATRVAPSIGGAAGAVISTLADPDRWKDALIDGGLMSERLQADRMTLVPTGHDGVFYGLGVMNEGRLIGHAGGIPGYTSFAGHDPETGANIVVLASSEGTGLPEGAVTTLAAAIVNLLPE